MLLFSAQYHTLCFYLSHWRTAAQQRTPADPALAKQNETETEGPNDYKVSSILVDDQLADQERRDLFMHSHISHLYISIYTPSCYVWKEEKRHFCKMCSCGGLAAAVLLSFLCPLRCLPNTVDLKEEKSLITPQPPAPTQVLQSPNQVAEDAKVYL